MNSPIIPLPIGIICIVVLIIAGVLFVKRSTAEDKELALYGRLRAAIGCCLFAENKVSIISADNPEDVMDKYTREMNRLCRDSEGSNTLLSLLGIPQMDDIFSVSDPEWMIDQSGNIVIMIFYKQYTLSPNRTKEDYEKAVSDYLAFKAKEVDVDVVSDVNVN